MREGRMRDWVGWETAVAGWGANEGLRIVQSPPRDRRQVEDYHSPLARAQCQAKYLPGFNLPTSAEKRGEKPRGEKRGNLRGITPF